LKSAIQEAEMRRRKAVRDFQEKQEAAHDAKFAASENNHQQITAGVPHEEEAANCTG
jgi:hypothetical protein